MDKISKYLIGIIIIVFLVMFFSSSGGYYEYELNKKTNLTKEAIERFEQDVKAGKEIDINNYVVKENKNYDNKFSKAGLTLSNNIKLFFSEGVKFIFNSLGDFVTGD